MGRYLKWLIGCILLYLGPFQPIEAQELEPRALTVLPEGLNFGAVAYAYASGNVLLDPSLPLEDFNGRINSVILAYIRSFGFFGKSAKLDIILPFAGGDFIGEFEGEDFEDNYTGFGDLRVGLSINFTGAPFLSAQDYKNFEQNVVSGLNILVVAPTGVYNKDQLANLGNNRWTVRLKYGVSIPYRKWIVEAFSGIWVFGKNGEFLGENEFEQTPLWVLQSNIIHSFNKEGMWLALSAGYGYGGRTLINSTARASNISQLRLGLTYALPIDKRGTLKFTLGTGLRFQQGGDYDLFGLSYSYKWLDKKFK